MTLSIISFFKYDNAILPLPFSHGLMEMRGKLFSSLGGKKKSLREHLARASNLNALFSLFFLI